MTAIADRLDTNLPTAARERALWVGEGWFQGPMPNPFPRNRLLVVEHCSFHSLKEQIRQWCDAQSIRFPDTLDMTYPQEEDELWGKMNEVATTTFATILAFDSDDNAFCFKIRWC